MTSLQLISEDQTEARNTVLVLTILYFMAKVLSLLQKISMQGHT